MTGNASTKQVAEPARQAASPVARALALLAQMKSLDVLRYTGKLTGDLLSPARLLARTDPVNRLLALCWPWSGGPVGGRRQVWMLVLLGLFRTVLMDQSLGLKSRLLRSVFRRDRTGLGSVLAGCCLVTALGSLSNALYRYNEERLTVLWRHALVEAAQGCYFQRAAYYHVAGLPGVDKRGQPLHIRDCGARITSDLVYIAPRLVSLVSALTWSLPTIVWFTFKLRRLRGSTIALLPHLYLVLAYEVAQRFFPKDIGKRYKKQAIAVEEYRQATSRVQTHAEAIVASGGCEREADILASKFEATLQVQSDLKWAQSKFQLIFKVAYSYGCRSWIGAFSAWALLQSSSLAGNEQVLAGAQPGLTGRVALLQTTFHYMLESLIANGKILTMHAQAAQMFPQCRRFCTMLDSLAKLAKGSAEQDGRMLESADLIKFDQVQAPALPAPAASSGRSSIFRCLGQLWPISEGKITRPGASATAMDNLHNIFYVPQKPYLRMGSIAEQITYPRAYRGEQDLSARELRQLLEKVQLGHLIRRSEEKFTNLEEILSRGEQQRLAIARLLFHSPRFAVLDECTSAVSREMEELLYAECKQRGISYITICHRPALKAFHDSNLNLTGQPDAPNGGYTITPIEHDPPAAQTAQTQLSAATGTDADLSAEQTAQLSDRVRSQLSALRSSKQARSRPASALDKFVAVLKVLLPGSAAQLRRLLLTIGLQTLCAEGLSRLAASLLAATLAKDKWRFVIVAVLNFVLSMVTAVTEEYVTHLQNRVSLTWCCTLSKKLRESFFRNNTFYSMKQVDKRVTDADQRITSELHELSEECAELWSKCITPLIESAFFTSRLHMMLGWQAMKPFYLYVVVASVCLLLFWIWPDLVAQVTLKFFLPDYTALNGREKELEARFQHVHTRLSTHKESIAFFGGDEMEHSIASNAIGELKDHMLQTRTAIAKYQFVAHCVTPDQNYSHVVSVSDLASLQMQMGIADQYAGDALMQNVVNVDYVASVSDRMFGAFSKLFTLYETFSSLQGNVARIYELLEVMDQIEPSPSVHHPGQDINLNKVTVMTPGALESSVCLAKDLQLNIQPNQSLIITGSSGVGKSSLFRVLAGLWPLWDGCGTVQCPKGVMLVPQRPYFVLGSLRDQVTYPRHIPADKLVPKEAQLLEDALKLAGIESMPHNYGGWDAVEPWEDKLSGGEQQRLCLARVFFHRPQFAILDECTDAVNVESEEKLYHALHSVGVTCITISKRLVLPDLHDRELKLGVGSQGWKMVELSTAESPVDSSCLDEAHDFSLQAARHAELHDAAQQKRLEALGS